MVGTVELWIGVVGATLGFAAIIIAIVIARRQGEQLRQLETIERDTGSTARKLNADAVREEFVRRFFAFDEEPSRTYKCIVPVRYEQRPLPLIPAGDYNALHVFQSLMGPRLLFTPVLMNPQVQDEVSSGESCGSDAVYLCSPHSNSALCKLAPAIDLTDDAVAPAPTFNGVDLPCWFANDSRASEHGGCVPEDPTMKLWICERQLALPSEAERAYRQAKQLPDGVPIDSLSGPQSDSAIVLRLTDPTDGKSKTVVVAGIHQYGTWIASEFFCRLAADPGMENRHVFVGDDDFVAIIWGEFNPKTFAVDRCGVHKEHLWVRQSGTWVRLPQRIAVESLVADVA